MLFKFTAVAAFFIAFGLTIPVAFSQSTLQEASGNPEIHEALLKKIARDKQEVQTYKIGHVVVGHVQLDGTDNAEDITAQMLILPDGFYSDAIKDLNRPISFRKVGYRPLEVMIPAGAAPDESGVIDLGTVRMERSQKSEIRTASGTISLGTGHEPSTSTVTLSIMDGRANTPHNGTEPRPKYAAPVKAVVDKSGQITATGLTEGEYYVISDCEGFVRQAKSFQVSSDKDLDLGTIRLERPLEFHVEYIVAENPATTFNPDSLQNATFPAGTKWKSRPGREWDLEFLQKDGTVTFGYGYGPCTMADLGDGKLADFVTTDFSVAKLDPREVPFTSGHVYLLNHQRSLKHVVLFRVEVNGKQQRSNGQPTRNHPSNANDPELLQLLTQRRDAIKNWADFSVDRLDAENNRDPVLLGRVCEVKRELLKAELEFASTKEARILLLERALQDQTRWKKMLEVRDETSDSMFQAEADRLSLEIELHRERQRE
ncbi:MAG: hypothetical protein WKF77_30395 [Planctomycetaceae bacterium]